ncbi:MAG: CPBP family intramembrane glutamic endopeptidase [Pseudomonadota bacterium]
MRYAPYETLITPARAKPELWRVATGTLLALAIYVMLLMSYGLTVDRMSGTPDTFVGMIDGSGPADTIGFLVTFIFMIAGTLTAAILLHGRGLLSLLGPLPYFARDGLRAIGALVALYIVVSLLPPYAMPGLTPNLAVSTWLLLLPISLTLVLIQVSAEEIFFRGYLQSQLAARFSSPMIWIVLPSILFGALHYSPADYGNAAWLVAIWATAFGMFAADLTARTGTLAPAIALHFVNNVSALLFLSLDGPLSGLALYTLQIDVNDPQVLMPLLWVDATMMLVSWIAVRLALRV